MYQFAPPPTPHAPFLPLSSVSLCIQGSSITHLPKQCAVLANSEAHLNQDLLMWKSDLH